MKNLAVFASGNGTNAEKIFEQFQEHPSVRVSLLLTNNPAAGVIRRAARFRVPVEVFDKSILAKTDDVVKTLKAHQIDWIALAGFMLMVPQNLIDAFPNRIVNIHPALLPAYGGKGMYGMHVHRAVVEAGESSSGITIHYVNERYDEGAIIFQASCPVSSDDTAETLAEKIHQLEHQYYPQIIEELMTGDGS
ncbi:MAG: phosphoribosylglycinamide formyltransferase [Cyclobacteriaceae bacterium]